MLRWAAWTALSVAVLAMASLVLILPDVEHRAVSWPAGLAGEHGVRWVGIRGASVGFWSNGERALGAIVAAAAMAAAVGLWMSPAFRRQVTAERALLRAALRHSRSAPREPRG